MRSTLRDFLAQHSIVRPHSAYRVSPSELSESESIHRKQLASTERRPGLQWSSSITRPPNYTSGELPRLGGVGRCGTAEE